MHLYEVEFEIAGPAAMFARPDTGAAPISYPVPTWSACKAMFESVARGVFHIKHEIDERVQPAAFFCPTEVEILRPIRFEKYVINYRGPLRKSNQISEGSSYQLPATILVDVCYRVKALCMSIPGTPDPGGNAPHALQEMFRRRLNQGKSKYAPSLGWKEFLPSYFGPYRSHDKDGREIPRTQTDIDLGLPAFLLSVWDAPSNGQYAPIFRELEIKGGRLEFPLPRLESGRLVFPEKQNAD
ncbi:MAG: CRISPR-associated protein Cas5 [Betaproteobacteria bacterium]|nr:CRISPR-associated protein Cas5 [Betaproteobacteria bacterium]